MDAADVLYGVSMGGDGVTKVVSRRLPREEAESTQDQLDEAEPQDSATPPFAGLAPSGRGSAKAAFAEPALENPNLPPGSLRYPLSRE